MPDRYPCCMQAHQLPKGCLRLRSVAHGLSVPDRAYARPTPTAVSLDTRMPGFAHPREPYRVILFYVIVDTLGQQTTWVQSAASTQPRPRADTYVREKRTLRVTFGIENPAAGSDYLCGRAKGIDAAARLDAAGPFDGEWYQ